MFFIGKKKFRTNKILIKASWCDSTRTKTIFDCQLSGRKEAYLRTFNMLRFDQVENVLEKLYVDVDFYELEDLVSEREFEDAYLIEISKIFSLFFIKIY